MYCYGSVNAMNDCYLFNECCFVLILHGLVTWLILPVVIRLSQRLSHACLSINNLYCETANGSLYQL